LLQLFGGRAGRSSNIGAAIIYDDRNAKIALYRELISARKP
jgi:hypothetical protein